jgi:hypothetical protein
MSGMKRIMRKEIMIIALKRPKINLNFTPFSPIIYMRKCTLSPSEGSTGRKL